MLATPDAAAAVDGDAPEHRAGPAQPPGALQFSIVPECGPDGPARCKNCAGNHRSLREAAQAFEPLKPAYASAAQAATLKHKAGKGWGKGNKSSKGGKGGKGGKDAGVVTGGPSTTSSSSSEFPTENELGSSGSQSDPTVEEQATITTATGQPIATTWPWTERPASSSCTELWDGCGFSSDSDIEDVERSRAAAVGGAWNSSASEASSDGPSELDFSGGGLGANFGDDAGWTSDSPGPDSDEEGAYRCGEPEAVWIGDSDDEAEVMKERALLENYPTLSHLLAGGFGGGITAVLSTPFDTIKVRTQTRIYVTETDRFPSFWHVTRSTVRDAGWQGLWRGAAHRALSNAPSGAIMFAVYEGGWRWLAAKLVQPTNGGAESSYRC